jgi:hypothetical protein
MDSFRRPIGSPPDQTSPARPARSGIRRASDLDVA